MIIIDPSRIASLVIKYASFIVMRSIFFILSSKAHTPQNHLGQSAGTPRWIPRTHSCWNPRARESLKQIKHEIGCAWKWTWMNQAKQVSKKMSRPNLNIGFMFRSLSYKQTDIRWLKAKSQLHNYGLELIQIQSAQPASIHLINDLIERPQAIIWPKKSQIGPSHPYDSQSFIIYSYLI